MSLRWIDIPSGWMHGWPKLYDENKDGEFRQWLKNNGCPDDVAFIRSWDVTEEELESERKFEEAYGKV